MTRIVNLTGHPLILGDGSTTGIFRSQGRIRIDSKYVEVEQVQVSNRLSIPLLELANGETHPIEQPQDGTLYVVSGLVAGRVKRPDVVAPARLHREGGKVQYARALLRYK